MLIPREWLTQVVAEFRGRSGEWHPIATARKDDPMRLLLARRGRATYGRVSVWSWAVSRRYVAGG